MLYCLKCIKKCPPKVYGERGWKKGTYESNSGDRTPNIEEAMIGPMNKFIGTINWYRMIGIDLLRWFSIVPVKIKEVKETI